MVGTEALMIASCQNCGTKSPDDELFCPNCGGKMTGNRLAKQEFSSENDVTDPLVIKKSYKEPTWTLRAAIFVTYFGLFMALATTGVFLVAIPISAVITIPTVATIFWVARGLGKYRKFARILLIVISLIILLVAIYLYPVSGNFPGLTGGFILSMALYTLYAMIGHKETVDLFSGKYIHDPDYLEGTGRSGVQLPYQEYED